MKCTFDQIFRYLGKGPSEPVSRRRTRGAKRLIAYSPKLSRRVQLHSRVAFELWLVLGADPNVIYSCLRPNRLLTETGYDGKGEKPRKKVVLASTQWQNMFGIDLPLV